MKHLVAFYTIFVSVLSCGAGCSTSHVGDQPQQGDTVVNVFGRRLLVPLGAEEPYLNIGIIGRGKHPDPRPNHMNAPGQNRQVVISEIRLFGVLGDEETVDIYFHDLSTIEEDKQYVRLDAAVTDYGKYVVLGVKSAEDGHLYEYWLYWFTPVQDHALQVKYVVEKGAFDELGGMKEIKRFAERVRLLPE
jgi:hypothetical protein